MKEQEWIEEAERLEACAETANSEGNEVLSEYYEIKARACRYAACYAPVEAE
jgi:hypothetical protein